ncbi:MAG TPA: lamin tail domain-containing protein [Negativicutes bacterium]|nr:lamin tail domain-containing protein [Negativicutes bacterium]
MIKVILQGYQGAWVDYDLTEMLRQVHGQLQTRKVLLVGHSQGTFYTNAAYDYLIGHGAAKESIGVYNVATPADKVAGGGTYLTSSTDKMISSVVAELAKIGNARRPLEPNIGLALSAEEQAKPLGGHGFSGVYLAEAPERIIGDIQQALTLLSSSEAPSVSGGCFIAPKSTLAHKFTGLAFYALDTAAPAVTTTVASLYTTAKTTMAAAYRAVTASVQYAIANPEVLIAGLNSSAGQQAAVPVVVENEDENGGTEEVQEAQEIQEAPETPALSEQDEIDDLLERIDMLKAQIAALLAPAAPATPAVDLPASTDQEMDETEESEEVTQDQPEARETTMVLAQSGSSSAAVYLPIMINEVQTTGVTDAKHEFVELYNPNSVEVDVTGWYLQRKTRTGAGYSTFAPATLFEGKSIAPRGYFLIIREGYPYSGAADIVTGNPLTDDNALVLKNPGGGIMDIVGFGQAQEYELLPTANPAAGQSVGRKLVSGEPTDTGSNLADFEAQTVTPRAQNITYVAPATAEPVVATEPVVEPEIPVPVVIPKLLINEIQIDSIDGAGGTNDDWVELYNPNDMAVDISGWSLQYSPESGTISKKNFEAGNVIAAHGYFLVARNTASAAILEAADITSSVLQLSATATVFLVSNHDAVESGDDADIVDKVGFGETAFSPETAPAPSPPEGKSIERKKLGQDTDNNATDFKISDEATPKGTFPKTTIQNLANFANNLSFGSPGTYRYDITFAWQSAATNIESYQVQYKINDGGFIDWLAATTKTTDIFQGTYSLLNDNIYHFRARAKDLDGNTGDWSPEVSVDVVNPVLISEVAFAGTGSSSEPWLELYNRSDTDIDLAGYKLVSGENGRDTINLALEGVIAAHGYLVVENFAENQALGKNYLYLRSPNNRYLDEFRPANSWDENFFMKDGVPHSAERVSMYSFGVFDKNWKLGTGTPGAQNSNDQLYTYYTTSFVENTTLAASLSPFVFRDNVAVFEGATVTVEPGTVIKFYDSHSRLTVHGTLNAQGTEVENIIFTSFADDEFGGDSNQDGDATTAAPGNWTGLYFSETSRDSALEHVVLRYGGSAALNNFGNALWVDHSSISLKNSVLENNKNRALMLTVSDSIIDNVQFLNHNTTDFSDQNQARAIYIQGGSPQIKNSRIENNHSGMHINYYYDTPTDSVVEAAPAIENNQFIKNSEPVYWGEFSYPVFSGNQLAENNINAITFFPRIVKNMELGADMPYFIKSVLTVPENVILTILPGAELTFGGTFSGLRIDGTLKAIGTPDEKISFKPYYFDASNECPGKWLGLRFTGSSVNSELENVVVAYGGAYLGNPQNVDFYSGVKVESSAISLRNAVFDNNANAGVWLVNSASVVDAVAFGNHQTTSIYGLFADAKAIYVQGGAPEIKNSEFTDNWYGIFIDDLLQDDGTVITGAPAMENNQFSGSIREDVHYVHPPTPPAPVEPVEPPTEPPVEPPAVP